MFERAARLLTSYILILLCKAVFDRSGVKAEEHREQRYGKIDS